MLFSTNVPRLKLRVATILGLLVFALGACSSQPPAAPPPPAAPVPPSAPEEPASGEPVTEQRNVVPEAHVPAYVDRAVEAPDRSAADRTLDPQRKPKELLSVFGIRPNMRVAEIAAGNGYTTELLARVVGPEGKVYGQNNAFVLQKFAEGPWSERLQKPVMQNVTRIDSELDAPLDGVEGLDAVVLVLFYHDTVWMKTDRGAMNRAVYAALKPGGIYGIVDHSARPGDGVAQAKNLHRIEESVVVSEVEQAGFQLVGTSDFLRNPSDPRDWNAAPSQAGERRGQSDRFVLKFRKPDAELNGAAEPQDQVEPTAEVPLTRCQEPRSAVCTREYRPVCAEVDTGVRCVKAPCPSTQRKTFPNACTACADDKVIGYRPGVCPPSAEDPPHSR